MQPETRPARLRTGCGSFDRAPEVLELADVRPTHRLAQPLRRLGRLADLEALAEQERRRSSF
jgi:hypothetical protein